MIETPRGMAMKQAEERFEILVLPQGVAKSPMSKVELSNWVSEQLSLIASLDKVRSSNLIINNTNYGATQYANGLSSELKTLAKAIDDNLPKQKVTELLESYLEPARKYRRLIANTEIANRILTLSQSGKDETAHIILLLYSDDFQVNNQNGMKQIEIYRATLLGPVQTFGEYVVSAKTAAETTAKANTIITERLLEIDNLVVDQRAALDTLHKTYHEKLSLEAPAENWQSTFTTRTKQWRHWLTVFVVLLCLPFLGALLFHDKIPDIFVALTSSTSNLASSFAVISAPVLLYAWLLRQVSRVFIRSYDLAIDAAHRKALTTSFLGFAANKDVGMTANDRAIILHALFRPQPPHLGEDGPPTTLFELLKGKE
jgi:Family of unknown function (DUF6161)